MAAATRRLKRLCRAEGTQPWLSGAHSGWRSQRGRSSSISTKANVQMQPCRACGERDSPCSRGRSRTLPGSEHSLFATGIQGPSEQGQEQRPTLRTSQSLALQKSEGQASPPEGGSTVALWKSKVLSSAHYPSRSPAKGLEEQRLSQHRMLKHLPASRG